MTIESPERLPDDILEIAAAIPPVPRGLGVLRQVLALLPEPLMAQTQGSFPADELVPPGEAGQQLGTQPGVDTIGPGAIADGAIGTGQIRDGALKNVAVFASTIRPVLIVNALPALPDPDYPVGQFVYNLADVPPTLYKNEAGAWVKAIGPADIQANSITAGQIAAGAVSTSELAVGARLTGEVANETGATPGVFIDSSGILIRSGKLTLQDEFGETTMQASGFEGSWSDFIRLGLYNAMFTAGNAGSLPLGRTSSLPYWTVGGNIGTGAVITRTADSTFPGGYRLRFSFTAFGKTGRITSDMVPVVPEWGHALGAYFGAPDMTVGLTSFNWSVIYYDKDGVFISQVGPFGFGLTAGGATPNHMSPLTVVGDSPANARFAQVVIEVSETLAHSSGNYVDVGMVWFQPVPLALHRDGQYDVDDLNANTLFAGTSLYAAQILMGSVATMRIRESSADVMAIDNSGSALSGVDVDSAYLDVSGILKAQRLALEGTSGTSATGTRNDTNVGNNAVLRFSGGAAVTYTGFTCTDQSDGRVIILRNASGNTMTLKNQDAGSAAGNRIITPGAVDFVIQARGGAIVMFDGTDNRWYVVSK